MSLFCTGFPCKAAVAKNIIGLHKFNPHIALLKNLSQQNIAFLLMIEIHFFPSSSCKGFDVDECDVMSYCMYPDVFVDFARFKEEFGPVTGLPTRAFLVGPDIGEEFEIEIEKGKTLHLKIIAVGDVTKTGDREVFCEVNGQMRTFFIEDSSETKV